MDLIRKWIKVRLQFNNLGTSQIVIVKFNFLFASKCLCPLKFMKLKSFQQFRTYRNWKIIAHVTNFFWNFMHGQYCALIWRFIFGLFAWRICLKRSNYLNCNFFIWTTFRFIDYRDFILMSRAKLIHYFIIYLESLSWQALWIQPRRT